MPIPHVTGCMHSLPNNFSMTILIMPGRLRVSTRPQKCCSKGFGICHVFTCYILSNPNLEKRPKLLTSLAQSINRKGVQPKISASWSNSLQRALRFCCARCSQEQVAENLSGSPGAL